MESKGAMPRNPSMRRKTPVVKQTKTSMYRMVKANPLLLMEDGTKSALDLRKVTLPQSVINISLGLPQPEFSRPNTAVVVTDLPVDKNLHRKPVQPKSSSCITRPTASGSQLNGSRVEAANLPKRPFEFRKPSSLKDVPVSRNKLSLAKPKQLDAKNGADRAHLPGEPRGKGGVQGNVKPPQRTCPGTSSRSSNDRVSISSLHRRSHSTDAKKSTVQVQVRVANKCMRRSKSAETYNAHTSFLRPISEGSSQSFGDVAGAANLSNAISPINARTPKVSFKTPTAYNRRSVLRTPSSVRGLYASTPTLAANDLQRNLNEWLRRKGKSQVSYHHLKCFDVSNRNSKVERTDEENKENVGPPVDLSRDESYENLGIASADRGGNEDCAVGPVEADQKDFQSIARDALDDLLKLIQDGYPQELCEAWLGKMHRKCGDLPEEPQYWECQAALEQHRGNFTRAVECYKTAIVKGAEVQTVDASLEQLLQKFSVFNLNTDEKTEESKKKARILLDASNVFKSTIIQFAVQEKMLKKKDNDAKKRMVVVTPVRRSARLSSSARNTKLCSSLKEAEQHEDVCFKNNSYLAARYATPK